ncbi:MAG: hypothetical protein RH946_20160 [Rhodospirillales bacterium]
MRTESTQGSPIVAASAATAAFQVAVVQQKQFEETLERVNEKQNEAVKETIRKAERTEDVVDINGIDKVLETSNADASSSSPPDAPQPDPVGAKLNVSV